MVDEDRSNLYSLMISRINITGASCRTGISVNDDNEICCPSMGKANTIAGFLEALGIDNVITGTADGKICHVTID